MEKKLIETGKIVTTHGIRGEVRIDAWCDGPDFLLEYANFYLEDGRRLEVEFSRVHKNCLNAKFVGIDGIDAALELVNKVVYIDSVEKTLPAGVYFVRDLIGLRVYDADTETLYGEIVEVQSTGSNDVYYVKGEKEKTYGIPAIKDVIVGVDIGGKTMKIRPLPGLMDL